MSESNKPIIYSDDISIRFGDLDFYGHVSSPAYLNFIISSRWNFLENNFDLTSADLVKRGLGFFLVNSNINYKKSVGGTSIVKVNSWVSEISGSKLTVEFTIEENKTRVSDGSLKFAIMDLGQMKPQALPEWANHIFWS